MQIVATMKMNDRRPMSGPSHVEFSTRLNVLVRKYVPIGKIVDIDVFKENVDSLFDSMKECPKAEGVISIKIPGEIENEKEAIALKNGIELSVAIETELKNTAAHYGVEFF